MDTMEQQPGYRQTLKRVQWIEKSFSVVRVVEGLTNKHSFEPDHLPPAKRDPSLTIEDMGGKVECLERLHSILLPSIKHQLTLLLNSLDLIDPSRNPEPVTDQILEILSNLDRSLESTVSATVSITLEPPVPDEKHDHGLENLKGFRCANIRRKIQFFLGRLIYDRLFRDVLTSYIQWCAIANFGVEDDSVLKEGSDLRKRIKIVIAYSQTIINETIKWCRNSDWAIIQESWLEASEIYDEALEIFTSQTNPTIQSTWEADHPNDNNIQRDVDRAMLVEVAKSAIPPVKLGRILIKKTSGKISKKRLSTLGTTPELNSEKIKQLYETPQSIIRLKELVALLKLLNYHTVVIDP
ncbi:hypothetical protein PtB15_15B487 [Puccinia triticina]|nr:hypothetical protein PtB15_15B487 [Puccinia triticina]